VYSVDADNPHLSAMVIDQAFRLKPAGDTRDARSLHAHHLSQELLGERQISSCEVVHPDQPRAGALFNAVKRVARRRLLHLTQGELLVLDDQSAKIEDESVRRLTTAASTTLERLGTWTSTLLRESLSSMA
jgi:hypothetical protein